MAKKATGMSTSPTLTIKQIDYSNLGGGLGRMLDRFRDEGTLTGDPTDDAYLARTPAAALLGLLYDQRVRAEYAFTGPRRLHERLGHLDLRTIAAMSFDALQAEFERQPAVHRFTNRMCEYTRQVAAAVSADYAGRAEAIWNDGADFETIRKRILALPGFGPQKAGKMKFVLHYLGYRDFS